MNVDQQQSQIQQNNCVLTECDLIATMQPLSHNLQLIFQGLYNNNLIQILVFQDDLQQKCHLSKKCKKLIQAFRKKIIRKKNQFIPQDLNNFTISNKLFTKSGKTSIQQAYEVSKIKCVICPNPSCVAQPKFFFFWVPWLSPLHSPLFIHFTLV